MAQQIVFADFKKRVRAAAPSACKGCTCKPTPLNSPLSSLELIASQLRQHAANAESHKQQLDDAAAQEILKLTLEYVCIHNCQHLSQLEARINPVVLEYFAGLKAPAQSPETLLPSMRSMSEKPYVPLFRTKSNREIVGRSLGSPEATMVFDVMGANPDIKAVMAHEFMMLCRVLDAFCLNRFTSELPPAKPEKSTEWEALKARSLALFETGQGMAEWNSRRILLRTDQDFSVLGIEAIKSLLEDVERIGCADRIENPNKYNSSEQGGALERLIQLSNKTEQFVLERINSALDAVNGRLDLLTQGEKWIRTELSRRLALDGSRKQDK